MLTYGVPSFKLEKDLIEAEIDVIKAMGVEIKCGIEVGVDVTIQQLRDQGYKGFLYCDWLSGRQSSRHSR